MTRDATPTRIKEKGQVPNLRQVTQHDGDTDYPVSMGGPVVFKDASGITDWSPWESEGCFRNLSGRIERYTAGSWVHVADDWLYDNVSSNVSPAEPFKTYYIDATGSDVVVELPDVSATVNGQRFQVIKRSGSYNVSVTTASGTDLIGGFTSQAIPNSSEGLTIEANNGHGTYEIIQDSRAKTPSAAINYYGTTNPSGISTYLDVVTSTDDPLYNPVAVDVPFGPITGADQFVGAWISAPGSFIGLLNEQSVEAIGNLRRTSGNTGAQLYAKIYKRASGGAETLLATTSKTPVLDNSSYEQFDISGVVLSAVFGATDRFLIKLYMSKVGTATDPSFELQLMGANPGRVSLAVPASSIAHNSLASVQDAATGIAHGHITASSQSIAGIKTFEGIVGGRVNLDSDSQTISTGSITIGNTSRVIVDTEGAAASDDLDSISGGEDGDLLVVSSTAAGRTVVVKNGATIKLAGGADFSLAHPDDVLFLMYVTDHWVEISRSDNS